MDTSFRYVSVSVSQNAKLNTSVKHLVVFLTFCLTAFILSMNPLVKQTHVHAASTSQSESLIVGIYHAPPFAIDGDDDWDGIGVHLWRDVAEELEIDYEWRTIDPEETTANLTNGIVDVVIGAVANADDERLIDFSHSYFASSIGTAEPTQRKILEIASAFFSPRFWQLALWLAIAFLVVGVVAWLFERQSNGEQFHKSPVQGIWAGFWWAGVTMSTIGYGDKTPITVPGRILALLWMIVAMGITAVLTASLTSVLTLEAGLSSTKFPDDLRRMDVGSVAGSASAQFLQEERIQFQPYESLEASLTALTEGELSIVADDAAKLRFVNSESISGALRIKETGVYPQYHVFALAEGNELREALNRVILDRIEEPAWRSLVRRYIAQD